MVRPVSRRRYLGLQRKLGYSFKEPALLAQALTHSSYHDGRERGRVLDNERLEFLGDAVLELAVRDHLLKKYPRLSEGDLSRVKAMIVNGKALASVARALSLGSHLRLGKSERMAQGGLKDSILANAYEALLGATYLDGGYGPAASAMEYHFFPRVSKFIEQGKYDDYKTRLQEYLHRNFKAAPVYFLRKETGKQHEKVFEVALLLQGRVIGTGRGKTKKEAEQRAARRALAKLEAAR